ncbi:F-BAR and double SH3 domains protein 2 [Amphibalanus amphitrite]|uniref:F-BAR and double SH3 domains protein 2 n=1 Tax=Amphibalanus amphitrite TaxID=1232801 RepID=A0A6A4WFP1_AMPAM|nr:F-BAR and double SH3 domains protein 2 [Amphibalanus amphitrite]
MESVATPPTLHEATAEAETEPDAETSAPAAEAPSVTDAPPELPVAAPIESVCDERNQLKLKIKGPFLNPSYNVQPAAAAPESAPAAAASAAAVAVNSNLRKRKKELIRQYVNSTETVEPAPPAPPQEDSAPVGQRFVCPKAVKEGAASGAALLPKRRGRQAREQAAAASQETSPNILRISFGKDGRGNEVKPPKKRPGELAQPAGELSVFEKIRQDNLQYGDQMLASFDQEPPPHKKGKKKKKKKEKDKDKDKDRDKEKKKKDKSHKHSKVQIINNDTAAAPKLIIKLGGRKLGESPPAPAELGETPPPPLSQPTPPPSDENGGGGPKDLVVKIKTQPAGGGEPGRLQPLKLMLSRRGAALAAAATPPPPTLTPEVGGDLGGDGCDVSPDLTLVTVSAAAAVTAAAAAASHHTRPLTCLSNLPQTTHAKFLKALHSEQLSRAQAKNQQECDLLEDIRNFTKQRAAVEKSYAEALLKISSAYLHKKIPQLPEIQGDGPEQWNVFTVWRTLLDETEKLAKARMAAVEVFQQRITDEAKTVRTSKVQTSKKCLEQLQAIQKELQGCVQELDNCKKRYQEDEHVAHDIRDRAQQAEEKLKKKKGFFTSLSSLQKNSAKLSAKKDQVEEKSTSARNEYLLQIASASAHQKRYHHTDLQHLLRTMEGDTYEKIGEYLTLIGRTELLTCSAEQASFTKVRDQAQAITPQYNIECYHRLYPVLAQDVPIEFEPCEGDSVDRVRMDHNCTGWLEEEAIKWTSRLAKETRSLRESQKRLQQLISLKERGEKSDPADPSGMDIDLRIDEMKNSIRWSETAMVKCQARIQCLRDGGVNVDEFMNQFDVDQLTVEGSMCRSGSQLSVREQYRDDDSDLNDASPMPSPVPAGSAFGRFDSQGTAGTDGQEDDEDDYQTDKEVLAAQSQMAQLTEGWGAAPDWGQLPTTPVPPAPTLPGVETSWPTDPDWGQPETGDEAAPPPPAESSDLQGQLNGHTEAADTGVPPAVGSRCIALFHYEAQNPDELTIVENEPLEITSEGDGDGWVRARNQNGDEGLIPHNYVEVETEGGVSFSSVDYGTELATIEEGQEGAPEAPPVLVEPPQSLPLAPADGHEPGAHYCRALYDYEATCPEELTLIEDQIIRVLRTVGHDGVDDGWWEGELEGRTGLFPSLVVEDCHANGDPLTPESETSGLGEAPPVFTPPDVPASLLPPEMVIVTQPTPQPGEQGDGAAEQQVTGSDAAQSGGQESASCTDIQIAVTAETRQKLEPAAAAAAEPAAVEATPAADEPLRSPTAPGSEPQIIHTPATPPEGLSSPEEELPPPPPPAPAAPAAEEASQSAEEPPPAAPSAGGD